MKKLSVPSLTDGRIYTNEPLEELGVSQPPPEPIRTPFSPEDEARITKLIFTLFLTQKRYGMHPDDVPAMGKAYSWALRGYLYKDIYEAVTALVRKMTDIPTPADIIARMEEIRAKAPMLPPPSQAWVADLAKEIGEIPARSWFKDCEWDGKTLKAPNHFTGEFITRNYKNALDRVFKEWELA